MFCFFAFLLTGVSAWVPTVYIASYDVAVAPGFKVMGAVWSDEQICETCSAEIWVNDELTVPSESFQRIATEPRQLTFDLIAKNIGRNDVVAFLIRGEERSVAASTDFYVFPDSPAAEPLNENAAQDIRESGITAFHSSPGKSGRAFRSRKLAKAQVLLEHYDSVDATVLKVSAKIVVRSKPLFGGDTNTSLTHSLTEEFPLNPIGITCIEIDLSSLPDGFYFGKVFLTVLPSHDGSAAESTEASGFDTMFYIVEEAHAGRDIASERQSVYDVASERRRTSESEVKILWPAENATIAQMSAAKLMISIRCLSPVGSDLTVSIALDGKDLGFFVNPQLAEIEIPEVGPHTLTATLIDASGTPTPYVPASVVNFFIIPEPSIFSRLPTAQRLSPLPPSHHPQNEEVEFPDLTLLVLTWNGRATLSSTLATYLEAGILSAVNETIILFQQISVLDYVEFGGLPRVRIVGDSTNLGIGRGQLTLFGLARTKYILFLEHDWELSVFDWRPTFRQALGLVVDGTVRAARLRDEISAPIAFNCHIPNPISERRVPERLMNGLYCSCFSKRHVLEPTGLPPDQTGPRFWRSEEQRSWAEEGVRRCSPPGSPLFFCVPLRLCGFTNNPTIYEREWALGVMGAVLSADGGLALRDADPLGWKFYAEIKAGLIWPFVNASVAVPYRGIFNHNPIPEE